MATYQAIPNRAAPARAIPDRGIPQYNAPVVPLSSDSSGNGGYLKALKNSLFRLKALK